MDRYYKAANRGELQMRVDLSRLERGMRRVERATSRLAGGIIATGLFLGGVLLRITGKDKIWPKSLEAQINAGDAGDFWGLGGFRLSGPSDRLSKSESPNLGRLTNLKKAADAEKRPGEWNQYEIVADGGTVILKINGQEVNRATGCDVEPGAICLTAEGDEIEFREVRLVPLK